MKASIKTALIIALQISAIFFLQEARAGEDTFSVRSMYSDLISNKWANEVTWVFHKNGALVTVTREKGDRPFLALRYSPDGLLEAVEDHVSGIHGNRQIKADRIVLSWGFPVPFDYLAPHDEGIKEAVVKKKAGGVTFSYRLTREVQEISLEDAVAENMVDREMATTLAGKTLRMITVRKGDRLLVRQLWPDGASWWVYEETPVRRSWRE